MQIPSFHTRALQSGKLLCAFLILSSVCVADRATAGNIIGRLVKNGQPVPFATFSVHHLDDGVLLFSTFEADADGTFNVPLEVGNHELGTFISGSSLVSELVEHVPPFFLAAGQTLILGELRVLDDLFNVTGTVLDGTIGSMFADLTAIANVGGVSYNVWSFTEGDGTFALRLANGTWTITAEDFFGSTGEITVNPNGGEVNDVVITLNEASPYAVWAGFYGLSGANADLDADPDQDGHNNAHEFAFGTNPALPTPSLVHISNNGPNLTVAWLEREEGFATYLVRNSADLQSWRAAAVDIGDGTSPAPAGYVRKQFTVPSTGKSFFRVLATLRPELVPDESFTITVAGAPVTVERWGFGPKGIVFFGFTPFHLEELLKEEYVDTFADLVGDEYSMFLWTYPDEAAPFSEVDSSVTLFFEDQELALANRLNLSGQAKLVVQQVRAITGLQNLCLVGNSFGAGILLYDFETLVTDPLIRFVMISPSELFMPFNLPLANPLPRTVLVADALNDDFFLPGPVWTYIRDRTNGPPPPGYAPGFSNPHFIIGELPTTLEYVFNLIGLAYDIP